MEIRKRKKRKPLLPINSMSDIAFLLLIFIMLISLMNYRKEMPIEYSEAENLEVTQADSNVEFWINSSGTIFYKGAVIDETSAEYVIVDAVAENPATRIHIIADRDTLYKDINKLLEVLKLLEHRAVSLVIKEKDA
jgi:biopolymer transport protein ExbD